MLGPGATLGPGSQGVRGMGVMATKRSSPGSSAPGSALASEAGIPPPAALPPSAPISWRTRVGRPQQGPACLLRGQQGLLCTSPLQQEMRHVV